MDEVGTILKHERSDHVIPIPRPTCDAQLGTTNGCHTCHADKGVSWQDMKMQTLFGKIKPHPPLVAGLFSVFEGHQKRIHPRGTKESLKAIERVISLIDQSASIAALYAISILVGEVLAAGVEAPEKAAWDSLWQATKTMTSTFEPLDASLLLFSASNATHRSALFESMSNETMDLTALKRKVIYNLIGIDHAYSGLSREARTRIRTVMIQDGIGIGEQLHEFLPAIGASFSADRIDEALKYFRLGADSPIASR